MIAFTFGSLFAGIGGIDLGLERAGMVCRWQVEIDDYATKVLEKHWPNVARFRDVRSCGAHNLEAVDLIAAGFPCQPHSQAGKRLASRDSRDLWGETYRLIGELRPKWALVENVPGILTSETGRFFGRILRDLASLGYDAEWESLPAAAFGAPHRRDRVFIVAYANGGRCGEPGHRREGKAVVFRWAVPGPESAGGGGPHRWLPEPAVGRVVDGPSGKMDRNRLRCLGNAVVPQVAEWIGKQILRAAVAAIRRGVVGAPT